MEKALIGEGGGEVIDTCKRGHGLWFDGGELDRVIHGLKRVERAAGVPSSATGQIGSFLADVLLGEKTEKDKGDRE